MLHLSSGKGAALLVRGGAGSRSTHSTALVEGASTVWWKAAWYSISWTSGLLAFCWNLDRSIGGEQNGGQVERQQVVLLDVHSREWGKRVSRLGRK